MRVPLKLDSAYKNDMAIGYSVKTSVPMMNGSKKE